MDYMKYSIIALAVISLSYGIKVDMKGSFSFGKDVLDTLTNFMRRNNVVSRRSMGFSKESDVLYLIVKSTYLCREIPFCEGKLEMFLNEYITLLTKSVEAIFRSIINQEPKQEAEFDTKTHIFEKELKVLLRGIRLLLITKNLKMAPNSEAYHWIDVIKRITAIFQEAAINFATDRLDDRTANNTAIKKKLSQKFIIATVIVEGQYESKLCIEYNVCPKSYECTKALKTLLDALQTLDNEKVKIFIRYVAEEMHESKFYSHVSEITANELQVILNDMAFTDSVPTKDVLLTILKTVDDRLSSIKANSHFVGGNDVELVHAILSDMDFFYSKQKVDPFHVFMSSFFDWSRLGTKLRTSIRDVMSEISVRLFEAPETLRVKLIQEVKAFLELTVDPEK